MDRFENDLSTNGSIIFHSRNLNDVQCIKSHFWFRIKSFHSQCESEYLFQLLAKFLPKNGIEGTVFKESFN